MVVVWCGVNWMIIRQVAIFLFFLFFKSSWYKIATAVLSPKQQRRPLPSLLFLSRVAAKKPLKVLSNFQWFSRIFRQFFFGKTHPFTKNKCFVVIFKFFLSNVIHNTVHKITKCFLFEFAKSWKFRSNFRNYPRLVYMNYSQLEIFSDPVDSLQGTFEAAPVLGLGPWEPRAGSVPTPSPTRPKLWFNLLHNFCVPRTNKILKYNCTVTDRERKKEFRNWLFEYAVISNTNLFLILFSHTKNSINLRM